MSIDTDAGTGKRDQRSSVASMSSALCRGARVPEPQPGDPVGVDVLGCALELGEDRELVARVSAWGARLRAARCGRFAR
jgi:hypothetical protein